MDGEYILSRRMDDLSSLYAKRTIMYDGKRITDWWKLTTSWPEYVIWFRDRSKAIASIGQVLDPLVNPASVFQGVHGWHYRVPDWDRRKHSYPPADYTEVEDV